MRFIHLFILLSYVSLMTRGVRAIVHLRFTKT